MTAVRQRDTDLTAPDPTGPDLTAAGLRYVPPPARPVGYLHPSRTSPRTLAGAARAAARPRHTATHVATLLTSAAGREHCVLTGSGRSALRLALELLGAGPGTEVVLCTVNCSAVADAVLATGATPVLVDFDAADGPAFTSVPLRGRPVVLTNGLGLDERRHLPAILDAGGLPVLDLAQAVPAPEVLARYADLDCPIVLSFGAGKPLGGIGGGALLVRADPPNPPAPRQGGFGALCRALGAHAVMHAPSVVRAEVQRRQQQVPGWSATKADHLPTEPGAAEHSGPTRWATAAASVLLASASAARVSATHEELRALVDGALSTCRLAASTPDLVPGTELLFKRAGQRWEFGRALAGHGVPSTWNYYPLHLTAPYARFAAHPLPAAEDVWQRVLSLPKQTQPRLTAAMLADRLVAADREIGDRGGDRA